jgi:hypothetical protein
MAGNDFEPQGRNGLQRVRPLVTGQGFERIVEHGQASPASTALPVANRTTPAPPAPPPATQTPPTAGGPAPGLLGPPVMKPPAETPEGILAEIKGLLQGTHDVLRDILENLRAQVQQGFVYPLTITTNGLTPVEETFNPPLFSISLTNDGPGTIQYRIPNSGAANWVNLQPTEVIEFNFIIGKIVSVAFRALGSNGTIRLVGTY